MENENEAKKNNPTEYIGQGVEEKPAGEGTPPGQHRNLKFAVIVAVVILAGAFAFYKLYLQNPKHQTLATVNGEKITLEQFNKDLAKLDPMVREIAQEAPEGYLENGIILKLLLLQEAKKAGITPLPNNYKEAGKEPLSPEDSIMKQYIEKKFPVPPEVTSEEIESVYKMIKGQIGEKSLKEMTPWIKQFIQQSKEREAVAQFLMELRKNSKVDINQKLLKKITVKTDTDEDLKKAIAGGKPVLVEFGSYSCPPCIKMRPFLKEIRTENSAKANVLTIDVDKYQKLAQEYKVTALPTMVFFDSKGKEAFRSVGYMEKEQMVSKLKEIGMGS